MEREKFTYDAALIHAFWLSQKDKGSVKLSLRFNLNLRAAALCVDEIEFFVLNAAHVWGYDYLSFAEYGAEVLKRKYHVPKERIIVKDNAFTTQEEIDVFLKEAKEREWKKLCDIAPRVQQFWGIPYHYAKQGLRTKKNYGAVLSPDAVMLKSTESIIQKKDKEKVRNLVGRLGRSKYELGFLTYEAIKRVVNVVDKDNGFLAEKARGYRYQKGPMCPKPFFWLPTDKYNL